MSEGKSPADFGESITHPVSWYIQAAGLLGDARLLISESNPGQIAERARKEKNEDPQQAPENSFRRLRDVSLVKRGALLSGFALENALKGKILEDKPEEVKLKVEVDGTGTPTDAEFREIGGSGVDHDLVSLAHAAGMFEPENNPLLPEVYDSDEMTEILNHIKHLVRWEGRYPEPLKYEERESLEEIGIGDKNYVAITLDVSIILIHQIVPEKFWNRYLVGEDQEEDFLSTVEVMDPESIDST